MVLLSYMLNQAPERGFSKTTAHFKASQHSMMYAWDQAKKSNDNGQALPVNLVLIHRTSGLLFGRLSDTFNLQSGF